MSDSKNGSSFGKVWAKKPDEVLSEAGASPDEGLTGEGVRKSRGRFGRNILRKIKQRSAWEILVDQFRSLVIGLLAAAAVVSLSFGLYVESGAITTAIVINTIIGFVTELKAVRSMDALRQLGQVQATVRREGQPQQISARDLVVGDIVVLDGGAVVSADMRLIEANKLWADESALTGESVPVSKQTETLPWEASLAERSNCVFKGTAITGGSGLGVVTAVGMQTELGSISEMVEEAENEQTLLEKLGRSLIWIVLGLTAAVAGLGILRGKESLLMIKSAVALAVAAVPEGLPIVATIALARGMLRMAKRNALVNRLASVETLGATSIICSDKTGTLTENRMTVARLVLGKTRNAFDRSTNDRDEDSFGGGTEDEGKSTILRTALLVGMLCNNAGGGDREDDSGSGSSTGDPMELALLEAAAKVGLDRQTILEDMPEEREEAFDRKTRMMATFHRSGDGCFVAVKGSPEAVLDASSTRSAREDSEDELTDEDRSRWNEVNDELANEGLRVIGLAQRNVEDSGIDPYENLTFLGLVGLRDPAREDVPGAVELCRKAGIRVIMVTGDQPLTARAVAGTVGLFDGDDGKVLTGDDLKVDDDGNVHNRDTVLTSNVFARVSPAQKLSLIEVHQNSGAIVAMTGDGVNDAPALKKADIGVAMGERGTEVAKQAADMVLKDDNFATIVVAVEHGRVIFDNIRKFVLYLLSGNVAEILAVAAASMTALPLPLLPLQILFLNFVLDVFPALALGVGEGDPEIMSESPRKSSEPILAKRHWTFIGVLGAVIAACGLGALVLAREVLGMDGTQAVTVSFLALAFGRLFHVVNMREPESEVLRNEVTRNKMVWGAVVLVTVLLVAAVYVPGLSGVLELTDPGVYGWLIALAAAIVPVIVGQILLVSGFSRVR